MLSLYIKQNLGLKYKGHRECILAPLTNSPNTLSVELAPLRPTGTYQQTPLLLNHSASGRSPKSTQGLCTNCSPGQEKIPTSPTDPQDPCFPHTSSHSPYLFPVFLIGQTQRLPLSCVLLACLPFLLTVRTLHLHQAPLCSGTSFVQNSPSSSTEYLSGHPTDSLSRRGEKNL